MRLATPVQLLLLAFNATGSMASPLAAPPANEAEVAARTTHAAVEKRSFATTCRNCFIDHIIQDARLKCECRRPGGQWVDAELALNKCIANRNGRLAWAVKFVHHVSRPRYR